MRRFSGKVGYGEQTQTAPGVWQDVITERPYKGHVIRQSRLLQAGENLNSDISVSNSISIVADAFAEKNFLNIRYVIWAGQRWTVTNVMIERPRLIMNLGEVYNGPIPPPAP